MRPTTAQSHHANGQAAIMVDGLQEESILIFPDSTRRSWED